MKSSAALDMDALREQPFQSALLADHAVIIVHCVDTDSPFQFSIPSMPFLALEGIFCHFSFPDRPTERRMCVLAHTAFACERFRRKPSPCIVEVESSVLFEVSYNPRSNQIRFHVIACTSVVLVIEPPQQNVAS